jgi:hypothetical protein
MQSALLHIATITLYNYQTNLHQGHKKSALWIMCPPLMIFNIIPVTLKVNISHQPAAVVLK